MNTKRTTILTAVTLIAVLVIPAVAATAEATTRLRLEGKGEFWVYGRGIASVRLLGSGSLTVRNVLENKIRITGLQSAIDIADTVRLEDHRGMANIEGEKIALHFEGGRAEFEGRGAFTAVLAGEGTYWLDDAAPSDWGDFGTIVAAGSDVDSGEFDSEVEDAVYEARSTRVVTVIREFPSYRAWSTRYPSAAGALIRTRNFSVWAGLYPSAYYGLIGYNGWSYYIAYRPYAWDFLHRHRTYVTWVGRYPRYGTYLRHPYAYHRWRRRHPNAHRAVGRHRSYVVWASGHPRAARRLEHRKRPSRTAVRHRAVVRSERSRVVLGRGSDESPRARSIKRAPGQRLVRSPSAQQTSRIAQPLNERSVGRGSDDSPRARSIKRAPGQRLVHSPSTQQTGRVAPRLNEQSRQVRRTQAASTTADRLLRRQAKSESNAVRHQANLATRRTRQLAKHSGDAKAVRKVESRFSRKQAASVRKSERKTQRHQSRLARVRSATPVATTRSRARSRTRR